MDNIVVNENQELGSFTTETGLVLTRYRMVVPFAAGPNFGSVQTPLGLPEFVVQRFLRIEVSMRDSNGNNPNPHRTAPYVVSDAGYVNSQIEVSANQEHVTLFSRANDWSGWSGYVMVEYLA